MKEQKEIIKPEFLLQEIRIAIKDIFIAEVHRCKEGINLRFPNGQSFTLFLYENQNNFKLSSKNA